MIDLEERIHSCFTGKNIGGTLGMPFEGSETRPNVDFYSPIPSEPVANDDLDLQLVWLQAFEDHGLALDAVKLGGYWVKHIDVHWDEYGVAINNLKNGIKPPLSGLHNNFFIHGLGAAIRSEIWASLFPGKPLTAGYFAMQDAMVDHAGEGVYTEIFWAVALSAVFGGASVNEGLELAKQALPDSSLFKSILKKIDEAQAAGQDFETILAMLMREHGSVNFTDVLMNCPVSYLALRYGEGDFEKTILLANNAGQDADCNAATTGALIGAWKGFAGIPERWKVVVGDRIKAGDYIKLPNLPETLAELTRRIVTLQRRYAGEKNLPQITFPVQLPVVTDFSEDRPYKVNGKPMLFEGIKLDAEKYRDQAGKMIHVQTSFCFPEDQEVNLMIATLAIFTATINGKMVALKGDQARPIPAHHRVRGGRIITLQVKKNQVYQLEVTLYPTYPVPNLYIGFFDWTNRHVKANFLMP